MSILTTNNILIVFSAASILVSLIIDYSFYRRIHPVYMTNQTHVNLLTLPLLVSYSLFTLGVMNPESRDIFPILILIIFTAVYVNLVGRYKIILKGAVFKNVCEEVDNFMKEQNKTYRFYPVTDHFYSIEINNYKDAITIKDMEKWVEIDSSIHKDDKFLNDLNTYFIKKVSQMESPKTRPNIFFYILVLVNFIILAGLIYYNNISVVK